MTKTAHYTTNDEGKAVPAPAGQPQHMQLTGSKVDDGGTQYTLASGGTQALTRAAGKTNLEIYVESGAVRVRADGTTATATTGRPVGEGKVFVLNAASASLYATSASTVTVVSS